MSTTMTTQTATGKSPCGCSGAKTGSPCCCGGAGCTSCQGEQFVRPRFFAGQLLTEDDLQSLSDYVAGKNRLHNRFLFGSGVVCGLQVKLNPCACGQVTVNPGYALDCCGNDIVVSCSQTLDINKMIRELKMKLRGGVDCGDPCAGTTTNSVSNANGSSVTPAAMVNSNDSTTRSTDTPRTYCLYVDYCETPTDPVAPYSTGGSCGAPTCEATRISEGFKFELRCPTKEDCDCSICKVLEACSGPASEKPVTANAACLREFASSSVAAVRAVRKQLTPEYSAGALEKALGELGKAMEAKRSTQREAKVLALRIRDVLVAMAPILYMDPPERTRMFDKGQPDNLGKAIEELDAQSKQLTEPLWKSYAGALRQLFSDLKKFLTPPARKAAQEQRVIPVELQLLAHGAVVTATYLNDCLVAARNLNLWLLEREDQDGQLPPVKAQTSQLFTLSLAIEQSFGLSEVSTVAEEAKRLLNAAEQHVKDCVCNALLPPCCSCTDTSVLLACITVQDCCVTEICNLDRKFILSPTAIRYWVPELHELGESIEKFCCPKDCKDDGSSSDFQLVASDDPSLFDLIGRSPTLGESVIASLVRGCEPAKRHEQLPSVHAQVGGALAMATSRLAPLRPSSSLEERPLVERTPADLQESLTRALKDLKKLRIDHDKLATVVQELKRQPHSESESSVS
jgi:hypothetical protein